MTSLRLLFAAVVFLSAFLLFQVQPIVGRYVLPWFGGGPAVWTTCLLFFQAALLCGYAYAHAVTRLRPRAQAVLHGLLLLAAVAVLPITPGDRWQPPDPSSPVSRVLLLLGTVIGLPFVALAATAPLVQSWFARLRAGESPYRLYALSNAGSLLALLSYPLLVEPNLSRRQQGLAWSGGMIVFALLCATLAAGQAVRRAPTVAPQEKGPTADDPLARSDWGRALLWIALPACGSALLAGITNLLTQDVASVPFLWVLPLALYLLTFILCFDHPRWYRRRVFAVALVPAVVAFTWLVLQPVGRLGLVPQVALHGGVLFICCMVCHGEVARLRPPARRLTAYYLAIAAGGALGGAFVAIAAPRLFTGFLEARVGVFACCALLLLVLGTDAGSRLYRLRPAGVWLVLIIALMLLGALLLTDTATAPGERLVARSRNFYGVLTVADAGAGTKDHRRLLRHGRVIHGAQFLDASRRREPLAYYGSEAGLSLALDALRQRRPTRRMGVVGLGAGTVAAYTRAGDVLRAYEIDPEVVSVARAHFTYLADTPAAVTVVLGDGRLSLEREPSQQFDVLILDAFSGDSVPAHLLTREALAGYLRHLRPGGLLAVNVSNHFLDLTRVVAGLAEAWGLHAVVIDHVPPAPAAEIEFPSSWALLSADRALLTGPPLTGRTAPVPRPGGRPILWTDDRSDLFGVLQSSSAITARKPREHPRLPR